MFVSTDNGAKWNVSSNGLSNYYIKNLEVLGNKLFAGTTGGVFVSTNDGLNWEQINHGLTNLNIITMKVIGQYIYVGTEVGLFLTSDQGINWTSAGDIFNNTFISCITDSKDNIFVGTNNSGLLMSSDNGGNWTRSSIGIQPYHINCLANSNKYIFAGTQGGGVYISSNKGESWSFSSSQIKNKNIFDIETNGSEIYIATDSIYNANEIDFNWKTLFKGYSGILISNIIIKGNEILLGSYSMIMYADLLKLDWKKIDVSYLYCLAYLDDKIFVGKSTDAVKFEIFGGGIFSTSNYGTSWEKVGYEKIFINGFFVQGAKLYALISGIVHLTTDFGTTWKPCKINEKSNFVEGIFGNENDVVVYNSRGEIYYSNDNGSNWRYIDSIFKISSLKIIDNWLYVGTTNRGMYRIDISDYVSVEDKPSAEEFSVCPNPAADFITIELGTINPTVNHAIDEVYIYNMLGEKVMSASAQRAVPLRINISDLPKGIYFVKVGERTAKFVKI